MSNLLSKMYKKVFDMIWLIDLVIIVLRLILSFLIGFSCQSCIGTTSKANVIIRGDSIIIKNYKLVE